MNIYDYAKYYKSIGWSIIPVKNKIPTIKWKQFQNRIATDEKIERWFKDKTDPQLGLALVTGKLSGITVLDYDAHDGSEPEYYHSKIKVRTGGGGYHLYYKYTEGLSNVVRLDGNPIDIRSEGGYVVLPPTLHESGKRYVLELEESLKETVKFLPKLQLKKKNKSTQKNKKSKKKKLNPIDCIHKNEGERNKALFKLGCSYINHQSPEDIATLLHAFNESYKPPLEGTEVDTIIKQVCKHKGQNEITIPTTEDVINDRLEELVYEKQAPSTGYKDLDEIIAGFVPGHVYLLSGETNSGKTSVAANFAVNVSKQPNRRVLYIALETGNGILEFFVGIENRIPFKSITEDAIAKYNGTIDILTKVGTIKKLLKVIKDAGSRYDLIIIDHIGYFITSENTNQEQSNLIKELAKFTKEQKVAIIAVAHPKKPAPTLQSKNRMLTIHDVSGSASLVQDSTEVIMVQRYRVHPRSKKDRSLEPIGTLNILKSKKGCGDSTIYFHQGYPLVTDTGELPSPKK